MGHWLFFLPLPPLLPLLPLLSSPSSPSSFLAGVYLINFLPTLTPYSSVKTKPRLES
ncbi:hypothetical protein H1Q63_10475 [Desmonostoc muscorum CCALA 125]|nr:hypothetical protein [Desmonostoc muscorum CCALA 125]